MRVFFDSSAFAKRFIREEGTLEVLHWCEQAQSLGISVIALPEIVAAFCRLRREGHLDQSEYDQLKVNLFLDIADADLCDVTPEVVQRAVACLEAGPLRGMDAIHVACALAWQADVFVTADRRQAEAAARAGLRVVAVG